MQKVYQFLEKRGLSCGEKQAGSEGCFISLFQELDVAVFAVGSPRGFLHELNKLA